MGRQNFDAKGIAIMTDVSVSATPVAPVPVESGAVPDAPNPNMTGEEAKAWVEAQKSKPKEPASNPVKEAAQEAAKRRLKISDDEEVDEDEVIKIYRERKGHQRAANKELQEGKAARKQVEEFITMMRDPDKFFDVAAKLGLEPRSLTEKYLAKQLEEELLTPEQKAWREKERKLSEYERREKEAEEAETKKQHDALVEKYRADYNTQFVAALQEVNVPKDQDTVAAMAAYIAKYAKAKIEITATEAAKLVKEDLEKKNRIILSNASPEQLIALIGEENANKVRKWDTGRLKSPESNLKTPTEQADPTTVKQRGQPKKRMTPSEWREFNRR